MAIHYKHFRVLYAGLSTTLECSECWTGFMAPTRCSVLRMPTRDTSFSSASFHSPFSFPTTQNSRNSKAKALWSTLWTRTSTANLTYGIPSDNNLRADDCTTIARFITSECICSACNVFSEAYDIRFCVFFNFVRSFNPSVCARWYSAVIVINVELVWVCD